MEARSNKTPVIAYLGLGANLGDREASIEEALRRLDAVGRVRRRSDTLETEPWGFTRQPTFLNAVVELETRLSPRALLRAIKRIEAEMGRVPTFRNGPRLIDIDILLYGDAEVSEPGLRIPHPRMTERAFVMLPLEQIAPEVAARLRAAQGEP